MSGGGTNYRKKAKLAVCFRKIRLFFNKLEKIVHKSGIFRFRAKSYGGILIEFAFSIPVLILLMYFVHDHYRLNELHNKVKTSAYLAASMLQQITNNRTEKSITKTDIRNIAFASCLNFFHNDTMFYPWPFGVYYAMDICWVKRKNSNEYQCQQPYATFSLKNNSKTIEKCMNVSRGSIVTKTLADIKAMHKDWECEKDGDERLVIICSYRTAGIASAASMLGFLAIPALAKVWKTIIQYKLVITPKPGLFPAVN